MSTTLFSPATTLGAMVAAHPLLSRVFERIGLDYCCGGKRTLAESCAAKGLDAGTVAVMLEVAVARPSAVPVVDAAGMTLVALADHIEATHHAYLRDELPALVEKADRVAAKHGERDPRLAAVATTMRALTSEMFSHMLKEEQILFPLVRTLERDGEVGGPCGSLAHPIRQMESEHDGAGAAVARMRELTDGFTPAADACNTHRALLAGLAGLELDLHEHVHKENNVLFPRALALEAQLVA
ncbi:MAG: iron-sulfur cluster repair di-iron protein [Verrucomicrobiota bacterium]